MQINPHRWYYNLPLVLLSVRNTPKAEIKCCPAELVFGQSVAFQVNLSVQPIFLIHIRVIWYKNCLNILLQFIRPILKSHSTHHVDKELKSCSHVWLRNDFVKGPFQPKYSGPYEVVSRSDKVFSINFTSLHNQRRTR